MLNSALANSLFGDDTATGQRPEGPGGRESRPRAGRLLREGQNVEPVALGEGATQPHADGAMLWRSKATPSLVANCAEWPRFVRMFRDGFKFRRG